MIWEINKNSKHLLYNRKIEFLLIEYIFCSISPTLKFSTAFVIDGGIFLVATITATYMLFNCNFYIIWKFHFLFFFFFIFIMEWNIAWFSRYFCVIKGWESKLAYYLVWWLDAILTVTKLNTYILYSHKVFLTFMVTSGYLALVLKNCIYL